MGQVPQPGVYECPEREPLLVDVVRRAGGLTDEASGNIRIVRNGRNGQVAFYSPQLDFRLKAGDVVIAERERHPARASGSYPPAREATSDPQSEEPVQVAFLNLIDRPVVLRVRPHHANLPAIIELLGQSPEVAGTVRILDTRPGMGQSAQNGNNRNLQPGSVLVFEPKVLESERLPELPAPNPVANHEATPGEASPVAIARAETPRESFGAFSTTNGSIPNELRVPGRAEVTPMLEGGEKSVPNESVGYGGETIDSTTDRISNLSSGSVPPPPRADAAVVTLSQVPPEETIGGRGYVRSEDAPLPRKTERLATAVPLPRSGNAPLVPQESSLGRKSSAAPPISTIAAILGGLAIPVAIMILWSMAHAVPSTPTPVSPESPARHSVLDRLIDNEMPVEERPIDLPETMVLFGRATGPAKLRIDAAHGTADRSGTSSRSPVAGPHFRPASEGGRIQSKVSQPKGSLPKGSRADGSVAGNSERGPHWKANPEPAEATKIGLLDRVLSTVHGADRS